MPSNPIVHVAGARPNFPKLAPVVAALDQSGVAQRLLHTGQHYDERLSGVFFRELGLPEPDANLGVGSGSHAYQTAAMMTALEDDFLSTPPRAVVVYGDVNSTVAAALVAAKLHIPIAHVEAGLRSGDRAMPEEINRIVTDSIADVLLTTSSDADANLVAEGVAPERIHLVGNTMIDTLLRLRPQFDRGAAARLGADGAYVVATLHRPSNVDDPERASTLVSALHGIAEVATVVIPLHPRGGARLREAGLAEHPRVIATDPLGYLEFMGLVEGSAAVVTDSGGIQEETTVLGVPCFTLRSTTERPVTITHGTNRLSAIQTVVAEVAEAVAAGRPADWPVPELWDGQAGPRVAERLLATL